MDDAPFPIDMLKLKQREILLLGMMVMDIGLQIIGAGGSGIADGVDPIDDPLLLRNGETLIELPKGALRDLTQGHDVKETDLVMRQIDDENTDRVRLLIEDDLVLIVAAPSDD